MGLKIIVPLVGGGPPTNVTLPFTGMVRTPLSPHPVSALTARTKNKSTSLRTIR
jgi:hypothetical protein